METSPSPQNTRATEEMPTTVGDTDARTAAETTSPPALDPTASSSESSTTRSFNLPATAGSSNTAIAIACSTGQVEFEVATATQTITEAETPQTNVTTVTEPETRATTVRSHTVSVQNPGVALVQDEVTTVTKPETGTQRCTRSGKVLESTDGNKELDGVPVPPSEFQTACQDKNLQTAREELALCNRTSEMMRSAGRKLQADIRERDKDLLALKKQVVDARQSQEKYKQHSRKTELQYGSLRVDFESVQEALSKAVIVNSELSSHLERLKERLEDAGTAQEQAQVIIHNMQSQIDELTRDALSTFERDEQDRINRLEKSEPPDDPDPVKGEQSFKNEAKKEPETIDLTTKDEVVTVPKTERNDARDDALVRALEQQTELLKLLAANQTNPKKEESSGIRVKGIELKKFTNLPDAPQASVVDRLKAFHAWIREVENDFTAAFPCNGVGKRFWASVLSASQSQYDIFLSLTTTQQASWAPSDKMPSLDGLTEGDANTIQERYVKTFLLAIPRSVRDLIERDHVAHPSLASFVGAMTLVRVRTYRATNLERMSLRKAIEEPSLTKTGFKAVADLEDWRRLISITQNLARRVQIDYSLATDVVSNIMTQATSGEAELSFLHQTYRATTNMMGALETTQDEFTKYFDYCVGLLRNRFPDGAEQVTAKKAKTVTDPDPTPPDDESPAHAYLAKGGGKGRDGRGKPADPVAREKAEKEKKGKPCEMYNSGKGCIFGKICFGNHDLAKAGREGGCWHCGQRNRHLTKDCKVAIALATKHTPPDDWQGDKSFVQKEIKAKKADTNKTPGNERV